MRIIMTLGAVMVLATLIAAPSAPAQSPLANARKQLETAIFHSGELAQRGTAVAASKTHLQHTLNCLEGAQGQNFNAAPGDVCRGQGNGIIPDLRAAEAAGVRGAGNALIRHRLASSGIAGETADHALESLEPEEQRARRIVARRGTGPRTARYLSAKGFTEDVVRAVAAESGDELG